MKVDASRPDYITYIPETQADLEKLEKDRPGLKPIQQGVSVWNPLRDKANFIP